jgi:hypothetical protein
MEKWLHKKNWISHFCHTGQRRTGSPREKQLKRLKIIAVPPTRTVISMLIIANLPAKPQAS